MDLDKNWIPIALAPLQTIYAGATFHRDKLSILSRPTGIMTAFLLLTWGAVAFQHFDRREQPVAIVDWGYKTGGIRNGPIFELEGSSEL